ncbi:hypothetical protein CPB86DRAFT_869533 [Serendipita vermifera]|nr:hypothetical protein CPB86DRAFT_869533 [Serendipita vermifera]
MNSYIYEGDWCTYAQPISNPANNSASLGWPGLCYELEPSTRSQDALYEPQVHPSGNLLPTCNIPSHQVLTTQNNNGFWGQTFTGSVNPSNAPTIPRELPVSGLDSAWVPSAPTPPVTNSGNLQKLLLSIDSLPGNTSPFPPAGAKPFICFGECGNPPCLKCYSSKELLRRHYHPEEKRKVACLICGKEGSRQNAARHQKSCFRSHELALRNLSLDLMLVSAS